jgi:7-cyano-7-deazaguanine synthase
VDALLLSGGLDSIAIAAWKKPEIAITVDYGQICAPAELRASAQVCEEMRIAHHCIQVNAADVGSGDLSGKPAHPDSPASEWWPFRNQFLLTVGAMRAIALGLDRLLIGTVKSDAFHADGTAAFIDCMDAVLRMQEGSIRVSAPALQLTSAELIRMSGVPLSTLCWAHSCHTSEYACGRCRGCYKHHEVMAELGHEAF